MSDYFFDVVKRWAVDEWYGEMVIVYRQGLRHQPVAIFEKSDMERLIKEWTQNRKVRK